MNTSSMNPCRYELRFQPLVPEGEVFMVLLLAGQRSIAALDQA